MPLNVSQYFCQGFSRLHGHAGLCLRVLDGMPLHLHQSRQRRQGNAEQSARRHVGRRARGEGGKAAGARRTGAHQPDSGAAGPRKAAGGPEGALPVQRPSPAVRSAPALLALRRRRRLLLAAAVDDPWGVFGVVDHARPRAHACRACGVGERGGDEEVRQARVSGASSLPGAARSSSAQERAGDRAGGGVERGGEGGV